MTRQSFLSDFQGFNSTGFCKVSLAQTAADRSKFLQKLKPLSFAIFGFQLCGTTCNVTMPQLGNCSAL